jgi:GNAT superfamily N-acetyltransferase
MIRIRLAETTDLADLAGIFLNTRLRAFHWCDPSSFRLQDFAIQTEGEIIHVAEDPENGTLLGFISVWSKEHFVHHLYVTPDQQRNGTGSALLRSLRSWLPFPHRLKCLEENHAARAFYRKHGWIELNRGSDALGHYLLMEYDGGSGQAG